MGGKNATENDDNILDFDEYNNIDEARALPVAQTRHRIISDVKRIIIIIYIIII